MNSKRLNRNADVQASFTEAKFRKGVAYGGKGGASQAPDYTGAAREQAAASQELATQNTWANRPTQTTPWGQTTWGATAGTDPATGQAITQWEQTQTLDPALQSALDDQLAIQAGRSDIAGSFLDRVRGDYAQPFNWAGAPGMANTPGAQFTSAQPVDARYFGPTTSAYGGYGVSPTGQDTSAPGQTTFTTNEPAFAQQRMDYMNAALQRMQPSHQRAEDSVRTMLANQGLTPGSEAYNTELERLHQQQAGERWNALEQSGQEQARMQQMLLGQQQQAFGQDVTSQNTQNQALMNLFQQQMGAGQMGLTREQQAFQQMLGGQGAYNQAMQQQYGQNLGANAQNFQQMMQMANFQNQNRQQFIAEEAMRRGMSLNELNALLTGQQVGTPNMPSFNQATMGQAPQLLQAAGMQGQYQNAADKLNMEADQALWGGIGKLAGAAGMFMSDARLKSNVKRVGTHPIGVGIYEYDIFGHRERGVMAQELLAIRPDLVYATGSGYLMVNYGGL